MVFATSTARLPIASTSRLTGLLGYRPDLVVSGINNGANMGDDTIYSGTVGAAMEGYLFGIPAIAFSQTQKGWAHLDDAARMARELVAADARQGRGRHALVAQRQHPEPADADRCRAASAALAAAMRAEKVISQTSPHGETMYWIGPAGDGRGRPGHRFPRHHQGQVSITPLQVDLTDHASLPVWRDWASGAS